MNKSLKRLLRKYFEWILQLARTINSKCGIVHDLLVFQINYNVTLEFFLFT